MSLIDFSKVTPNITIFTDASHCPESWVGGGAYWMRDDDRIAKRYFDLPKLPNSSQAELFTALRAINDLFDTSDIPIPQGKWRLILVTDCMYVKQCLEHPERRHTLPSPAKDQIFNIHARLARAKGTLKVNHVKAHTKVQDARSWVNRWCDKHASKAMRRQPRTAISGER